MPDTDYAKIAAAIHFIRNRALEQPVLDEVAEHLRLSPFHCQRLFQRWAGVSPKRYLQYLTSSYAKSCLAQTSLLEASWEVGLSGSGRLHDLFVAVDAVTPGEYKSGGAGLTINWGVHPSPFGDCLIGLTERGICALHFVEDDETRAFERLRKDWPSAEFHREEAMTSLRVRKIFAILNGEQQQPLPLLLKGTNLQLQVWKALLRIPTGRITSYGQLASAIGKPKASRAVGSAIGANPIAWLIPCHRVLRSDGQLGGYRWGEERKLAILGQEWGRQEVSA